jgi:uncharacterized protein
MNASVMDAYKGRLKLLVVQPTPFCNIDCTYCYLAGRRDTHRLSKDALRRVLQNLAADNLIGNELEICWHLGEPLSVGRAYYEDMIPCLADAAAGRTKLSHTFQTNGTLIDEAWCAFFRGIDAQVGVSLDGPKDLHDSRRVTRRGVGTFDQALAGFQLLREAGIRRYIIAVLSMEALRDPDRIFDFFAGIGETNVCFNIEESEGIHASSIVDIDEACHLARRFFTRLLERLQADTSGIWVRELQQMLGLLMTSRQGACLNDNNEPFRVISVAHDGSWTTFSPELISTAARDYGDFRFGNLGTEPISNSLGHSRFAAVEKEIRAGVEQCRAKCPYFNLCGGGAPSNKIAELGTLAGTETMACRTMVKSLADGCMDFIEATVLAPRHAVNGSGTAR